MRFVLSTLAFVVALVAASASTSAFGGTYLPVVRDRSVAPDKQLHAIMGVVGASSASAATTILAPKAPAWKRIATAGGICTVMAANKEALDWSVRGRDFDLGDFAATEVGCAAGLALGEGFHFLATPRSVEAGVQVRW